MRCSMLVWWILIGTTFIIGIDAAAPPTIDTSFPKCQPIPAKSKYQDALFVFLYEKDSNPGPDVANHMRYVFKQISCQIPKADNLQTYVVNYGLDKDKAKDAVAADFVDSAGTAAKLVKAHKTVLSSDVSCERYKTHVEKFVNSPLLKNRTSIQYIMFSVKDNRCTEVVVNKTNLHIIYYEPDPFIVMDKKGIEQINGTMSNAPPVMKTIADRILSKKLIPIPQPATDSDESGDVLMIIIVAFIVTLIALIASYTYFFLKLRKLDKEEHEEQEGPASNKDTK